MLAMVAVAWQQTRRGRPVAAGALLALAVMIKPQDAFLVPVALLVSGRIPAFLAFVASSAVLAVAFLLALGTTGVSGFLGATAMVQADPIHQFDTLAFVFGIGPVTYAAELVLGAIAMVVAYSRRAELDVVFALGLLGSVMASPHLHQPDYAFNVLAAWLVLRTGPGLAHRVWLVAGIPACQLTSIGLPLPQLLWQTAWLGLIARDAVARRRREPVLADTPLQAG
jgi:hypothetical protein